MPRTNLRELTLDIIQENGLSKKKILEMVRKQSGKAVSDKTLNEILMNLLKDGEIYITGYDFDIYNGMKRIQSIKAEGIIFSQITTDPMEISILIKQLESDDPQQVKSASHKLKLIFNGKMNKLDNFQNKSVNSLFNKVIYYINSQKMDQKAVLINKLAWSLSDEDGSTELLNNLIQYIKTQG